MSGSPRGRWPTRPGRCSADAGLDGYVTWFAAQHLTEIDVADLVGPGLRCAVSTTAFLADHRADGRARPPLPDEQAFAGYLRLIDEWRLFPRLDPGLPESLLPPDWPARAAWELFDDAAHRVVGGRPAARPQPSAAGDRG